MTITIDGRRLTKSDRPKWVRVEAGRRWDLFVKDVRVGSIHLPLKRRPFFPNGSPDRMYLWRVRMPDHRDAEGRLTGLTNSKLKVVRLWLLVLAGHEVLNDDPR